MNLFFAREKIRTAIWQNTNVGAGYPPTFVGTGSQTTTVVTISATTSGYIEVGMTLAGAVSGTAVVTSFGTYTHTTGVGTVNVSTSGSVGSGAITGHE